MQAALCLDILSWFAILVFVLLHTCRLNARIESVSDHAHYIRGSIPDRPADAGVDEGTKNDLSVTHMDSFILYSSTLRMRASLLAIPFSAAIVSGISASLFIALIVIFQTGVLKLFYG